MTQDQWIHRAGTVVNALQKMGVAFDRPVLVGEMIMRAMYDASRVEVEAEREACAKVAERRRDYWEEMAEVQQRNDDIADPAKTAERCRARAQGSGDVADLIRARGGR